MDFTIENHGSLFLLRPESDQAREWVAENVEDAMRFGHAVVIEPRYVEGIVEGILADGLTVE